MKIRLFIFFVLLICLHKVKCQENTSGQVVQNLHEDSLKKINETINVLSKLIEEYKISIDSAYYERSKLYLQTGDLHKALHDVDISIRMNEKNHKAHFLKGMIKCKAENYPGAIKSFDKAILLNPSDPKYHYDRALAFLYSEDIDKAIKGLSKAIELNSNYSRAYFSRGYCYELLGKNDEALQDLNKAIEIEKNSKESYIEIASIYIKKGELEKACAELQMAIDAGVSISEEIKKTFCK